MSRTSRIVWPAILCPLLIATAVPNVRADSSAGVPIRVFSDQLVGSAGNHTDSPVGLQRWAGLLCKFSDEMGEPRNEDWFDALLGSSYPGMGHYWNEVSYGQMSFIGDAFGWYVLPQPQAHYLNGSIDELARDCAAAADADVYFPNYDGVNLFFNDFLHVAFGGWTKLSLDGVPRDYRATWLGWPPGCGPPDCPEHYRYQGILVHEIGHTYGLGHVLSLGGATYISEWDPMGNPNPGIREGACRANTPDYECVTVHLSAWHKANFGWILEPRTFFSAGTATQIALAPVADPRPVEGYIWAQLFIGGTRDRFYAVEARRRHGYDEALPGEGVIIHTVDRTRDFSSQVEIIDGDGNGNPNDSGAMWTVGETFSDPANGVEVAVLSEGPSGEFNVRILAPAAPAPRNFRLEVAKKGKGSVRSSPQGIKCPSACAASFAEDTPVQLKARAKRGWKLDRWIGPCETDPACTVTMTRNVRVRAVFERKPNSKK